MGEFLFQCFIEISVGVDEVYGIQFYFLEVIYKVFFVDVIIVDNLGFFVSMVIFRVVLDSQERKKGVVEV